MKILTVVGARPQFIKAAPVSDALQNAGHEEVLVHTGQHYDFNMSKIFFEELGIAEPDINLEMGSGSHGRQTGQMLIGIEEGILSQKPDCMMVYGDTNSTLSGALASVKLRLPVMHIEAGLRSFNRQMPEEYNRIITDHCSDLLFCPTRTAVNNLAQEGITKGVHLVGDTMYDAALKFAPVALERSTILQDQGLKPKDYLLATIHRPDNVDDIQNLGNILSAFNKIDQLIVLPLHPRTKENINNFGIAFNKSLSASNIQIINPVGYLDMLMLEQNARLILTDSGGIQKEAYFFKIPCVTLRKETEWVELVKKGYNVIAGNDSASIYREFLAMIDKSIKFQSNLFGEGQAAQKIAQIVKPRA